MMAIVGDVVPLTKGEKKRLVDALSKRDVVK